MADVFIADLPAAFPLSGAEILPLEQGGATRRVTVAQLQAIPAGQISGDAVRGGTISDFASTGIDDNAPSTALVIDTDRSVAMQGGARLLLDSNAATASAPALSFRGDSDTGLFRAAPDTLACAVGGTERLRVAADGTISLGAEPGSEILRVGKTGVLRLKAAATPYLNVTDGTRVANIGVDSANSSYSTFLTASNGARFLASNGIIAAIVYDSAGTVSLGALPGGESLRVITPLGTTTRVAVQGGSTTGPGVFSDGSVADVGLTLSSKGTGAHVFQTGASGPGSSGAIQFQIAHAAGAVNRLQATGGATGAAPTLSVEGSEANAGIDFQSKGSGTHRFLTGGGSAEQVRVEHVANAVNALVLRGAASGGAPTLAADGADANADVALLPKGSGAVRFGAWIASTDAPVNGYITIKDAGGTVRKLATIA